MGGKHKKCQEVECGLIASFGFNKIEGTKFCSKHKVYNMINLLCKLCSCGKSRPTYNYEGKSANFCKECKTDDMINVNGKNCFCGLSRPTFNVKGLKAGYCSKCKTTEMINVKDEPCKCGKSSKPNFNYKGLRPEYCSQCKLLDMVDISHARCHCGKSQPSFNYDGLSPNFCKECKMDEMIMIKKRLCITCNVEQGDYNIFGLKQAYCSQCKTDDMINISNKCKNISCSSSGNVKYRYYCTHCFTHLFPKDPLASQVRIKTKENCVRDYLNENMEDFIHDISLWSGNCDCSHRRRIDFRKLIGNTLLCIEVDENQHKRYSEIEEELRYDDLYMIYGGKFVFIRFNPDVYVDTLGTRVKINMTKRLDELGLEIKKQVERIVNDANTELLEIIYLFYDGFN